MPATEVWTFLPLSGAYGEGKFAFIDAADCERLSESTWRVNSRSGYLQARRGGRDVYMHRLILDLTKGDGLEGDHVNHDKLDNRRCNLRVATRAEQTHNCRSHRDSRSRYRGVSFHTPTGKWSARVYLDGTPHWLGLFDTEERAAEVAAAFRAEHMPFSPDSKEVRR